MAQVNYYNNKAVTVYTNIENLSIYLINTGYYKVTNLYSYDFVTFLNLKVAENFNSLKHDNTGDTTDIVFTISNGKTTTVTLTYEGYESSLEISSMGYGTASKGEGYLFNYKVGEEEYKIIYFNASSVSGNIIKQGAYFYYFRKDCTISNTSDVGGQVIYNGETTYTSRNETVDGTTTEIKTTVISPFNIPTSLNSIDGKEVYTVSIDDSSTYLYIGENELEKTIQISLYDSDTYKYYFECNGYIYKCDAKPSAIDEFQELTKQFSTSTAYADLYNVNNATDGTWYITSKKMISSVVITKASLKNYDAYIKEKIDSKISTALESYTKTTDLKSKISELGYITSTEASDKYYAKVDGATNITSSNLASNLASVSSLSGDFEKAIAAKITGYGYATETFVTGKGYATSESISNGYYAKVDGATNITSANISDYAVTSKISATDETFKNAVVAAVNAYLATSDGEEAVFNAYLAAAKTSENNS